jgi:hypothetical protein
MRVFKHNNLALIASAAAIIFTSCSKEGTTPVQQVQSALAGRPANEQMVITPAGMMPQSNVHFIGEGFGLHVENGHLQQVETKTGRLVEDYGEVKMTEGGFAPSNNIVPETQGWIAYTYWSNPNTSTPITSFTTKWVVPSVPSKQSTQTIFLFNGMQDGELASSYIIQPVLQWGSSAAGGGKYWAITNWYVSSSQAFFGPLVKVSAGTGLTGVMTQTAVSGSNYSYSSSFTGYPTTTINATNVPQAFWAAETLESYGVTTPNTEYPPNVDIAMTSIDILEGSTHPSITWTAAQGKSGAAQKAKIISNSTTNGEVDIYFRK